jgi:hypothetical protein
MSSPIQLPPPNFTYVVKPQKRVLWKWSALVASIVFLFFLWQCGSGLYFGYKSGGQAAERFHAQFNAGQYDEICTEADEAFAVQEQQKHFLEQIHKKLGDAGATRQVHINVNAMTSGTFVVSEFTTSFDQGQGEEWFTWRKSGTSLKLYRYDVRSDAFVK